MNIYDVAKEAGVSPSTVSRVLNNKSNVKSSTREKVMRVIEGTSLAKCARPGTECGKIQKYRVSCAGY